MVEKTVILKGYGGLGKAQVLPTGAAGRFGFVSLSGFINCEFEYGA